MKRLSMVLIVAVACMFSLSAPIVMAQIDYCEGNFDNDNDQDGTDAFVFKQDFGRSSLLDPCPVIACQTAEQLEMRIAQLEALLANVTRVTVDERDTLRFSGVNVQIVDGSGDTEGTVNGLGNLIIGYNELRGSLDNRSGSHNIVVGREHNYSSYGGLVAGSLNTLTAPYTSVSGGRNNSARYAYASVSGGEFNQALGYGDSVSGGHNNTANGQYASVSGGYSNEASGQGASISGGYDSAASGDYASVSGGSQNIASNWSASVSGGRYNQAMGSWSFVGGGGNDEDGYGNKAFADFSAILGGTFNTTGDPNLINPAIGIYSTVSGGSQNSTSNWSASVNGGYQNTASGQYASVSGGFNNQAIGDYSFIGGGGDADPAYGNYAVGNYSAILGGSHNTAGDLNHTDTTIGPCSSVCGGQRNTASGSYSSVGGGFINTASGGWSSVSGGNSRSVTGLDDWAAGALFQDN